MSQFAGKVTVVTSAGSGIGRALAVALTAEVARVAVSDVDTVRRPTRKTVSAPPTSSEADVHDPFDSRWTRIWPHWLGLLVNCPVPSSLDSSLLPRMMAFPCSGGASVIVCHGAIYSEAQC
jgi:hypothetical protein